MTKIKQFIQDHQAEIMIVGGVAVAVTASIALHKYIVAGERIQAITAYTNNKNDDLLLVAQKMNRKTESFILPVKKD